MTNRNKGILFTALLLVTGLALLTVIVMEIEVPEICFNGVDNGESFTACLD